MSAISALPGCEPQLKAHVSGARCLGVTDAQLRDIPNVLRQHNLEAEAVRTEGALAELFGEAFQASQTVDFSIWPKGEPNPYGQYFRDKAFLPTWAA